MCQSKIIYAAITICLISGTSMAEAANISWPQVAKSTGMSVAGDALDGTLLKDDDTSTQIAKITGHAAIHIATETASVPVAVSIASVSGMTASTGTAISTLSGAAATSATLAGVGTTVLEVVGLAGSVAIAAPAAIGGAIVLGAGALVAYAVDTVLF